MGPDKKFTGLNPSLTVVLLSQASIGLGVAIGYYLIIIISFILSMPILNDILLVYYPS